MDSMQRYARQTALPEIGDEGQRRLLRQSALVVGVGGLGSPVSLYLAAAGVGRIGLVDADTVSESNLQRQVLYTEESVGRSKVEVARERLLALSSHTSIETYDEFLTERNAGTILSRYDAVIDCCDNFATRYLLDDVARQCGKPLVHGSVGGFAGQVAVFLPDAEVRYADLYPEREAMAAAPKASGRILGAVPGIIGSMQAAQTIMLLSGMGASLAGRLFTIDIKTMQTNILELE